MQNKALMANMLMLLAAIIWGLAFVAQRVGMETMGPHLFNGVRFLIGALVLVPVIMFFPTSDTSIVRGFGALKVDMPVLKGGVVAGLFLFGGITFQQVGLQHTTAGKAGFITSLYIFFVPVIGLLFGMRTRLGTWIGALMALVGLYLLAVQDNLHLSYGDTLILLSSIVFAGHVLVIGYVASRFDVIKISAIQFFMTSILAFIVALIIETITWQMIVETIIPLAYAGVLSTGIAYTLQVVGQKYAHSAHAAIILSSEGAFAALGGWWLLNETLTFKNLLGCALILAGMLVSQLWPAHRAIKQTQ